MMADKIRMEWSPRERRKIVKSLLEVQRTVHAKGGRGRVAKNIVVRAFRAVGSRARKILRAMTPTSGKSGTAGLKRSTFGQAKVSRRGNAFYRLGYKNTAPWQKALAQEFGTDFQQGNRRTRAAIQKAFGPRLEKFQKLFEDELEVQISKIFKKYNLRR